MAETDLDLEQMYYGPEHKVDLAPLFNGPNYQIFEGHDGLVGHEVPFRGERGKSYVYIAPLESDLSYSIFDALHSLAIENLFSPKDRVAVKVNLGGGIWGIPASQTDPKIVAAVLDYLLMLDFDLLPLMVEANNWGHVIDDTLLKRRGYYRILEDRNVEYINLSDAESVEFRLRDVKKPVLLPRLMLDPRVKIINITPMKHHWECGVSLAQKNMYGAIADGAKSVFHRDPRILDRIIAGAARIMRPTLNIIGGHCACAGMGPHFCTPVRIDRLLISNDMIAVDRVGSEILGFPFEGVKHAQLNIAEGDPTVEPMDASVPFEEEVLKRLKSMAFTPLQLEVNRRLFSFLYATPPPMLRSLRHLEFIVPVVNDSLFAWRGNCTCRRGRRFRPMGAEHY